MTTADELRTEGALLFAGDVYCDLYFAGVRPPDPGTDVFADAFGIVPGGVANRAVAAARAGATTRLVSAMGDDPLGRHVRGLLASEPDLDLSEVPVMAGMQTPVSIALTGAEDRSFITYQDAGIDHGAARAPNPAHGPVAMTHVGIARELPSWVADLRSTGTRVVGGVGWDDSGTWSADVLDRLADVDVFVPNEVEAMRYTRTHDVHAAASALSERVPLVVVTRGAHGAVGIDAARGVRIEVDAPKVRAVDPTGAGDVFVATFMASLLRPWSLDEQLRFAALCASVSVTGYGGATSAPHAADLPALAGRWDPDGDWTFLTSQPSLPARADRTRPHEWTTS